jgi:hypothetical protein
MRIRIPHRLAKLWDRFGDWGDIPLFCVRGYCFRRIDLLSATALVWMVGGSAIVEGWIGAFKGLVFFVFMAVMFWIL